MLNILDEAQPGKDVTSALKDLSLRITSYEYLSFEADWQLFMNLVDQAKKQEYGNIVYQRNWFSDPKEASKEFLALKHKAEELSGALATAEDVRRTLDAINNDQEHILFYWYAVCCVFAPKQDNTYDQDMFTAVSDWMAQKISGGADSVQKKHTLFFSALALTTFSAKHGAKAFLAGLAKTKFPDKITRKETLQFLEDEVHPNIYSPLQFYSAARAASREQCTENEKRRLDRYIDRMLMPSKDKKFVLDEHDIYQHVHLNYPQGQANLPTDLWILTEAGLDKADAVFDPAAGEGLHAIPLMTRGINLTAGDYNLKYVNEIVQKIRTSRTDSANQGKFVTLNWNNIPFGKNTFDFVMFIGRNIHHLITSRDRQKVFERIRSVVRTGSVLVLDIGDTSTGKYQQSSRQAAGLFRRWRREWEDTAAVLDSPDGQRFTMRAFPSILQITHDAEKQKFLIDRAYFRYIPGSDARNIYLIFHAVS